jgi:EpsI family protein
MKPGRYAIVSGILAVTLLGLYTASRTAPSTETGKDCLRGLSLPFRDWTTQEQELSAHERDLLVPDSVLLRQYHSPNNKEEVGIAVIAGHRKQTVHTPAFCMAGGGWNTVSESNLKIALGSENVEAVRAVMDSEGRRILVTYFFTDGAHSRRSLPAFQFEQLLQRLRGKPASGALVRILTPILSDRTRAERLSDEFATTVLPKLLAQLREAHSQHP